NAFTESKTDNNILEVGETWTGTFSRTVQPGDPDPLPNTVTAIFNDAQDLSGDQVTDSDSHSVNLFQPSLHVVKSGDTLSKIGDSVDYTITVTNTSSSDSPDLVNVNVTDDVLGNLVLNGVAQAGVTLSGDTGGDGRMDPGEVWTITTSRTVLA